MPCYYVGIKSSLKNFEIFLALNFFQNLYSTLKSFRLPQVKWG